MKAPVTKAFLILIFSITTLIFSLLPGPANAEITTESKHVAALDQFILVEFSYEEEMLFMLASHKILELVESIRNNTKQNVIRKSINDHSEVSLVLGSAENHGCRTAFGTIHARNLQFEFGVLIDEENLGDKRPIFAASSLIECPKNQDAKAKNFYRLNSVHDPRQNRPHRFLSVQGGTILVRENDSGHND